MFFILRHRASEGFGQLWTSWNIYVELKKNEVPPHGDEEETLDLLQRIALT